MDSNGVVGQGYRGQAARPAPPIGRGQPAGRAQPATRGQPGFRGRVLNTAPPRFTPSLNRMPSVTGVLQPEAKSLPPPIPPKPTLTPPVAPITVPVAEISSSQAKSSSPPKPLPTPRKSESVRSTPVITIVQKYSFQELDADVESILSNEVRPAIAAEDWLRAFLAIEKAGDLLIEKSEMCTEPDLCSIKALALFRLAEDDFYCRYARVISPDQAYGLHAKLSAPNQLASQQLNEVNDQYNKLRESLQQSHFHQSGAKKKSLLKGLGSRVRSVASTTQRVVKNASGTIQTGVKEFNEAIATSDQKIKALKARYDLAQAEGHTADALIIGAEIIDFYAVNGKTRAYKITARLIHAINWYENLLKLTLDLPIDDQLQIRSDIETKLNDARAHIKTRPDVAFNERWIESRVKTSYDVAQETFRMVQLNGTILDEIIVTSLIFDCYIFNECSSYSEFHSKFHKVYDSLIPKYVFEKLGELDLMKRRDYSFMGDVHRWRKLTKELESNFYAINYERKKDLFDKYKEKYESCSVKKFYGRSNFQQNIANKDNQISILDKKGFSSLLDDFVQEEISSTSKNRLYLSSREQRLVEELISVALQSCKSGELTYAYRCFEEIASCMAVSREDAVLRSSISYFNKIVQLAQYFDEPYRTQEIDRNKQLILNVDEKILEERDMKNQQLQQDREEAQRRREIDDLRNALRPGGGGGFSPITPNFGMQFNVSQGYHYGYRY